MAWFDIGVNLFDARYEPHQLLQDSFAHDISGICAISSDLAQTVLAESFVDSLVKQSDLNTYPQLVFTGGVHPHYADNVTLADWQTLHTLAANKKICAVGECGLDFNRNFSTPQNQLLVFEQQLNIAAEYGLGVYLHERDAFEEQTRLIAKYRSKLKFVVAHCFTGNRQQLERYLALDCYIGITGWLCDPKRGGDLREAVTHLPLDRLLLETDSPYLFPKTVKPRKSTNQPKYLPDIAQQLSLLNNCRLIDIQSAAYENACSIFEHNG